LSLIGKLQAAIDRCDDGEGIPQWCVATGKCTCIQAKALIAEARTLGKERAQIAEAAFDLGRLLASDGYTPEQFQTGIEPK
jgi:hypothetical protein